MGTKRTKDRGIQRMVTIATLVFLLVSTLIVWGTYNSYLTLDERAAGQMEEPREEAMAVSLFKRIPIPEEIQH